MNAPVQFSPSGQDLLAILLDQQQSLTAVEKFSLLHDSQALPTTTEPHQAKYYKSLLPSSLPTDGYQYGFSVDLDKCSGCKACVVACHTLNGLDDDEAWRRVGTVVTEFPTPGIQHVTTACHHCVDPGCLNGCPVVAYEKDPVTGIVKHLDDQCIGCKYCTMTCPYEVPQYHSRLGIVRKCDMCSQRLATGEAPACVQACPNQAILIGLVEQSSAGKESQVLAPGAPDSKITLPTTVYKTTLRQSFQTAVAQDHAIDSPAEMHWPLCALLVLTQASVGIILMERVLHTLSVPSNTQMGPWAVSTQLSALALTLAIVGLALGGLHLGQPLRAWRVFLGLRTSWLSREAVVFGIYTTVLTAGCLSLLLGLKTFWGSAALWSALVSGVGGVYSSGMIYVATRRTVWRASKTLTRFFISAFLSGTACVLPVLIWAAFRGVSPGAGQSVQYPLHFAFGMLALAICLQFASRLWQKLSASKSIWDRRSQVLSHHHLSWLIKLRGSCTTAITILSGVIALFVGISSPFAAMAAAISLAMIAILGEFCDRLLYFACVVVPRMPGTLQ